LKRYEKSTAQTSLFHLKISLTCLQFCRKRSNWDDVTIRWCLIPARFSAMPHCRWNLQQAQCLLPFEQTVCGFYFPIFRYTAAAVDFIQQPIQTGSA